MRQPPAEAVEEKDAVEEAVEGTVPEQETAGSILPTPVSQPANAEAAVNKAPCVPEAETRAQPDSSLPHSAPQPEMEVALEQAPAPSAETSVSQPVNAEAAINKPPCVPAESSLPHSTPQPEMEVALEQAPTPSAETSVKADKAEPVLD